MNPINSRYNNFYITCNTPTLETQIKFSSGNDDVLAIKDLYTDLNKIYGFSFNDHKLDVCEQVLLIEDHLLNRSLSFNRLIRNKLKNEPVFIKQSKSTHTLYSNDRFGSFTIEYPKSL